MGLKFDPTVSLGNITALVACIASIFFAWATLDKRLAAVEIFHQSQIVWQDKDALHELRQDDQFRDVVKDIDRKLEKISDKMEAK